MKLKWMVFLFALMNAINYLTAQIPYPGESPGQAMIKTLHGNRVILENNVIRMEFVHDGKKINIRGFEDKKTHDQVKTDPIPLFELILQDSSIITSNDFRLVNSPVMYIGRQT